jgi:hypothetical protein
MRKISVDEALDVIVTKLSAIVPKIRYH